ncbi:hypothetical protein FQN49_000417 [Arthroderma sp. PD_2]|nr:hypothetical protein FQN49_000417 [Arthroderma sp. PD_2]
MIVSILLLIASLFAGLSAAGHCVEEVSELPIGWQQLQDAPEPTYPLSISIALRQSSASRSHERLTYSSSHLSAEEVRSLRAPDQADVDAVMLWLQENGIEDATLKDDWIHVRTTVCKAESLLDMDVRLYSFKGKPPTLRTKKYSVPDSLSTPISFIHPLANFMTPGRELLNAQPPPAQDVLQKRAVGLCSRFATPGCIRQLYNLNYTTPDDSSSVRFAVAGFLGHRPGYQNVDEFLSRYAPSLDSRGYNYSIELVDSAESFPDEPKPNAESALHMDYAMALGYPTDIIYHSTSGRGVKVDGSGREVPMGDNDNEPYLALAQSLLDRSTDNLPHVLSITYHDDELSVPRPYAEKACDMFGFLAKRGVSIIVNSGDGGARGTEASTCRSNEGLNREITKATFPAACPWVTAVGATTSDAEPPSGATFSSGGFSQYFERKKWQDKAVDGYVNALGGHLKPYYNPNKRALPDISVIGGQFPVFVNSQLRTLQGSGGSTAIFAAMIALINDARIRQGKGSLGWLNERLYSPAVRAVLQDITDGTSTSCVFDGGKTPGGWPAKQGWDAITGLGVPKDFPAFMQALLDAN